MAPRHRRPAATQSRIDPSATLRRHFDRGSELAFKYMREGNAVDIEEAITNFQTALSLCPSGHPGRGALLDNLANAFLSRHLKQGGAEDLGRAIQYQSDALGLRPRGHPDRCASLNNLSSALLVRHGQLGDMKDLDRAIQYLSDALNLLPRKDLNRTPILVNLVKAVSTRFKLLGDAKDLGRAIQYRSDELDLYPPGHAHRPASLENLAIAFMARYKQLEDVKDLGSAVRYHSDALNLRPPGHPDRPSSLNNLAAALQARYEELGDMEDLGRAIQYYADELNIRPAGHPGRSASLINLANALQTRHHQLGDMEDLERAIRYHTDALNLHPPGHPYRLTSLNNLANAVQARHSRLGDMKDLERAIQYHSEALNLCPPGHPNQSVSLSNLSNAYMARYNQLGDMEDLGRTIRCYSDALDALDVPPGHPHRPGLLGNLATAFWTRYNRLGDMDDLGRAIQYNSDALDLRPPGHPDRAESLGNFATVLHDRYEQLGDMEDLERVIQYHSDALDLRPPGHPLRAVSFGGLATALHTRYEQLGDVEDLGRALQHHSEALNLRPPGHPDRSASLNSLATILQDRYRQLGDIEDIGRAIRYYLEALNLRPPGHPNRSTTLNNLANTVSIRYKQLGDVEDLERAIQYHSDALDLRPPGHPLRSSSLINLAGALWTRYRKLGDMEDLERAIQHHSDAVNLCPPGHAERSASLNNLAMALQVRYNQLGDPEDLRCAIQHHSEALDLCPPGHPNRTAFLRYLAHVLHVQYSEDEYTSHSIEPAARTVSEASSQPPEQTENSTFRSGPRESSRYKIISLLREASQNASCSPRDCLLAALDWVRLSKELDPDSTLAAYTSALEQSNAALSFEQSLGPHHDRPHSHELLAQTKDLGVEAATWALQHGDLERAVELLEQGRSLLLAQIGRYRVEVDDLRLAVPGLEDRLGGLSLLDAPIPFNQQLKATTSTVKDPYRKYRKLSTEGTQTLERFGYLPGFEIPVKPIPYKQLQVAAANGPIIILILNPDGTDALIVRENSPIHRVNLPLANSSRLAELSNKFTDDLNFEEYNDVARERQTVENLKELWNLVVGPIAQVLHNDLQVPRNSRVWWCPTAAASFLPLHAAGLYSKEPPQDNPLGLLDLEQPPQRNFPDLYISSYTPTLQALSRARQRTNPTASATKKLLVISQPRTPGESRIRYAQDEVKQIEKTMSSTQIGETGTMTTLSSEAGTRKAVQREMRSHDWIHFICHGVQASNRPLDSYLSLHDGYLTLQKIVTQNLPNAELAFLAACHAAAGDKVLGNEGLHLAVAMHLVGFRSVVGTFWTVCDEDGPPLAEYFYEELLRDTDSCVYAVALSKAIKKLRRPTDQETSKVPIHRWMRFVHIGI